IYVCGELLAQRSAGPQSLAQMKLIRKENLIGRLAHSKKNKHLANFSISCNSNSNSNSAPSLPPTPHHQYRHTTPHPATITYFEHHQSTDLTELMQNL